MNILWLLFLLHSVIAQPGFGKSYLSSSRLCREWACVNTKVGLLDHLPPRQVFTLILASKLPKGVWQDTIGAVLTTCYDRRPRRYSNTCPGQALWHCVVDQLIENCPEESLKKGDACSPVQSLAGAKYMFSQRIYENFEENLSIERRPSWFLSNYYSAKCCNLPSIILEKELSDCGFTSLIHYDVDVPRYDPVRYAESLNHTTSAPVTGNGIISSREGDALKVVSLKDVGDQAPPSTPVEIANSPDPNAIKEDSNQEEPTDPLDCCDMSGFIRPTWRSECDFKVIWDGQKRLSIDNTTHVSTTEMPTTTVKATKTRDLMLVPYSCEKENCVFQKLGIVSESGSVDAEAFIKLLDKLTESQPWWTKAKARVVTTCLKRPLTEYEADCEINKMLSCTFDVLSENCPFKSKKDVCKHTRNDAVCQVSSSKYRPRKRRDVCYMPQLVNRKVLTECNLTTLSYATEAPEILTTINRTKKNNVFNSKYPCHDQTPSTTCLMGKMGILNKYNFMDHFKMKDRIRQFTSDQPEWAAMVDLLMSAFTNIPMYRDQCSSPKKLLNVVDTMLMTCPIARRKNTPQCARIFSNMANTVPLNQQNVTREKLDEILNHFHHVFMPMVYLQQRPGWAVRPKHTSTIVNKPIYDYGLLNSKNAPPVRIIHVKPTPRKPLILLPVYMRMPQNKNVILTPHVNDGVLRSSPFWLHNRIAMAHANATESLTTATPVSTNIPISTKATISTVTLIPTKTSNSTSDLHTVVSTTTEDYQEISVP